MKAIKFSSPTCMPCKALSTTLKNAGINIEEQEITKETSSRYGIRSVPTIVILDSEGNRMDSYIGANLTPMQMEVLKGLSIGN
jgi:glutaredoxin